jgi:hypothetical protein
VLKRVEILKQLAPLAGVLKLPMYSEMVSKSNGNIQLIDQEIQNHIFHIILASKSQIELKYLDQMGVLLHEYF